MTDMEQYRPTAEDRPYIGDDILYRNKGLGSQATAKVTRTVATTVADPEQFLPSLSSPMHVDLLVHGPRGDYREFDVAPGVEKGTWQWSQIPVDLLKPEPKFKVGDYVRVVGYISDTWEGAEGAVTLLGRHCIVGRFSKGGCDLGEGGFNPEHLRKIARPEPVQTRYKDGFWTRRTGAVVWKIEGNIATVVDLGNGATGYKVGTTADVRQFGPLLVPYDPPVNTVYKPREVPTPASFKVGDRVELVKDYAQYAAGLVGTVTRISGDSNPLFTLVHTDTISGGAFTRRFKHAAPAPKSAPFKHGDIIRRTVGGGPSGNSPTGTLYRIVTRGDRTYRVRLHDGFENSMPFSSHSAFELVSSDTR